MDTKENKRKIVWYTLIINFFKNIVLVIFSIFSYSFKGLKACTYDLFVFLYNSISWRLDKAYRRTKEVLGPEEFHGNEKKKKETQKTQIRREMQDGYFVDDPKSGGRTTALLSAVRDAGW